MANEVHTHQVTGEPFVRKPAGGLGGGVTSFASTPATEEEHLASLESDVKVKEAEIADIKQRHDAVKKDHEKHKAEQAKIEAEEKKAADAKAENVPAAALAERARIDAERKRNADVLIAAAAADEKRRKEIAAKAKPTQTPNPSADDPLIGQQSNPQST